MSGRFHRIDARGVVSLTDLLVLGDGEEARRCAEVVATAGQDVLHLGARAARRPALSQPHRHEPEPEGAGGQALFEHLVHASDWGADQAIVRRLVEALSVPGSDPDEVPERSIQVWPHAEAVELFCEGDRCWGAVVWRRDRRELHIVVARATVLSGGGAAALYQTGGTPPAACAAALAVRCGAQIGNPEAIQFHPVARVSDGCALPDSLRLRGGRVLDRAFRPLLHGAEPGQGPRDIEARRMARHLADGFGVPSPNGPHLWLDLRNLNRPLPGPLRNWLGPASDNDRPIDGLIPVRPAPHYALGGIRVDRDGRVLGIQGLFALGEAACWDLYGFNRASLSVRTRRAEGSLVGSAVAKWVSREPLDVELQRAKGALEATGARLQGLLGRSAAGPSPAEVRREIARILCAGMGILRERRKLEGAVSALRRVLDCVDEVGFEPRRDGAGAVGSALRLWADARLAYLSARAGFARAESRGAHYRVDFPRRDDGRWLVRTLASWREGAGPPALEYEPFGRLELGPAMRSGELSPLPMKQRIDRYNAWAEALERGASHARANSRRRRSARRVA